MGICRTFFNKNNTIIRNSCINTGKNPVTQLIYGGSLFSAETNYSRFLFQFDENEIKEKVNDGTICIETAKHTVKMVNTSFFGDELVGQVHLCDNRRRAHSVDVILFRIPQMWDEGAGFDFQDSKGTVLSEGNLDFCPGPSDWTQARKGFNWVEEGVYSGDPTTTAFGDLFISKQEICFGNENIELDITDAVNDMLTGNTPNYGFGIAFDRQIELCPEKDEQFIGFFTRHTQSQFHPYVETTYDDLIQDDRRQFYMDKPNKLYLYTNVGRNPISLDETPTVEIFDENGDLFSASSATTVCCVTKGVYCVDVMVPSLNCDCVNFTDKWSNIKIGGVDRPDVTMEFALLNCDDYYNVGTDGGTPIEYALSIFGVKRDESIIRGDIRKVIVCARLPFTIEETDVIDGLDYRLYIKQGREQLNIIDWEPVNRTFCENYFLIDTNCLIPGDYYIDIRLKSNLEITTYPEEIKFEVVSEFC